MNYKKMFSTVLLSFALFLGIGISNSINIHASRLPSDVTPVRNINHKSSKNRSTTANNYLFKKQSTYQYRPRIARKVQRTAIRRTNHNNQNWFRDGLNDSNYNARSWVSWHESNHRWNVVSYGHVCIGYFQLSPKYLGYKNGHVNLDHKHQVKVADTYASNRYGDWVHVKSFWQTHHWY